jgi:hypothetical protein
VVIEFLYDGDGILFEEARQVAEVRVLVKLVEDGARGIFEVGGGEDGDGVWRELFGELGAAFKVLESGDVRGDCGWDRLALRPMSVRDGRTFPSLQQMWMCLVQRLPEPELSRGNTSQPSSPGPCYVARRPQVCCRTQ